MSPEKFLIVNGLIVTIMVLWLLLVKGKKNHPTKLNLRNSSDIKIPEEGLDIGGEQELNVYFNFNGHSWDAHEILGVPAGSSAAKVREAYEQAKAKIDVGSEEIIELAYQALSKKK